MARKDNPDLGSKILVLCQMSASAKNKALSTKHKETGQLTTDDGQLTDDLCLNDR